jgi:hypothetical protein
MLAPTKKRREPKARFHRSFVRKSRQIERSADIAAAKRWLCCNRLFVNVMFVEDTRRERMRRKNPGPADWFLTWVKSVSVTRSLLGDHEREVPDGRKRDGDPHNS